MSKQGAIYRKMLGIYLSYPPFWTYLVALLGLWILVALNGALTQYWYALFLAPLMAASYEWLIHKYVLHFKVGPEHPWVYQYMKRLHYDHHESPSVPEYLFAQMSASLMIFLPLYLFSSLALGWSFGTVFVIGTMMYYLYYEWVHLGHHIEGHVPCTKYGQFMKKHHTFHHFKNENYWWGVTQHFFDVIMGTSPSYKQIERSGQTGRIS